MFSRRVQYCNWLPVRGLEPGMHIQIHFPVPRCSRKQGTKNVFNISFATYFFDYVIFKFFKWYTLPYKYIPYLRIGFIIVLRTISNNFDCKISFSYLNLYNFKCNLVFMFVTCLSHFKFSSIQTFRCLKYFYVVVITITFCTFALTIVYCNIFHLVFLFSCRKVQKYNFVYIWREQIFK